MVPHHEHPLNGVGTVNLAAWRSAAAFWRVPSGGNGARTKFFPLFPKLGEKNGDSSWHVESVRGKNARAGWSRIPHVTYSPASRLASSFTTASSAMTSSGQSGQSFFQHTIRSQPAGS